MSSSPGSTVRGDKPAPSTPDTAVPPAKAKDVRERVSIRKRKAIKYGRKIVRIRVGHTREMFVVHEELLCSQSAYFREKLQKHRKPIEGVCPVCHEVLDPTRSEITFCRSTCGVNMHHECMKSWQEEKSARSEAITCPMCRQAWPEENDEQALLCTDLDAEAFRRYYDWLYHRDELLNEDPAELEDNREINAMINSHQLSCKVRDNKFGKATLQALCELCQDQKSYPGVNSVRLVYRTTTKKSRLRKLVVAAYVWSADPDWFEDLEGFKEGKYYPIEFLVDLTRALLGRRTKSRDAEQEMENLMNEHCISEEDEDGEDG